MHRLMNKVSLDGPTVMRYWRRSGYNKHCSTSVTTMDAAQYFGDFVKTLQEQSLTTNALIAGNDYYPMSICATHSTMSMFLVTTADKVKYAGVDELRRYVFAYNGVGKTLYIPVDEVDGQYDDELFFCFDNESLFKQNMLQFRLKFFGSKWSVYAARYELSGILETDHTLSTSK